MGHTFSIGMGRGQREVHYTEVIYFREFTIRGFTCSLGAAMLHGSPQMVYGTIART